MTRYGNYSNDLVKKMRDYRWTVKVVNPRESEESEDGDIVDYVAMFEEEECCGCEVVIWTTIEYQKLCSHYSGGSRFCKSCCNAKVYSPIAC